jgi:hypothetical protein
MELSIIIVSYNQQALLKKCLESIYASFPSRQRLEVIVVDNHSLDHTVDMIRADFPQVVLIVNPANDGFAKANNLGLKIARGAKLLLLNNDTVILDNALIDMMAYLDQHPEIGLLGPKLLNRNGSIQAQGSLLGRHFWRSKIPTESTFLRGAALMLRREVFEQVGLLDERFFFYNEDLDYAWRVRKSGYKVVFYPHAEVVHYGGKVSLKRQIMGMKGSLALWKKWTLGRKFKSP